MILIYETGSTIGILKHLTDGQWARVERGYQTVQQNMGTNYWTADLFRRRGNILLWSYLTKVNILRGSFQGFFWQRRSKVPVAKSI
ncbi:MAG: hypothetical protein BMS9Abin02_0798 [Anaerolineae bacterium]|nr:MAG: hypothetical protein BMS9Abin02_0798 [Anaerolineae bacterium]